MNLITLISLGRRLVSRLSPETNLITLVSLETHLVSFGTRLVTLVSLKTCPFTSKQIWLL